MTFLDLAGLKRFLDKIKILISTLISTHDTSEIAHNTKFSAMQSSINSLGTSISGLQGEATAKWITLNVVEVRSLENMNDIEYLLTIITEQQNKITVMKEQISELQEFNGRVSFVSPEY